MYASSNQVRPITLVLASGSPRRQELIATLGLPVRVRPSHADEDTPADWSPARIVEELSLRKARAAAEMDGVAEESAGERAVVVGSDTIVVLDGEVMGKPADDADAKRMLARLAGRTHEVLTGVTCLELATGDSVTRHRVTKVRMRPLSEAQIDRYVASGEPRDKAGAYGIQGGGSLLVESIEGCYFGVVGLPLSLLADMLETFGVSVP